MLEGSEMRVPRWNHAASLLPDGSVLIVGGFTRIGRNTVTTDVIERYLASNMTMEVVGTLRHGRALHTTELLDDGSTLVIGGYEQKAGEEKTYVRDCEIIPPQ